MLAAVIVLLATPLIALFGSFVYAAILFWPTMILLGAVHSWLPWVPALGATPTFLVLALLYLLIPTKGSSSKKD